MNEVDYSGMAGTWTQGIWLGPSASALTTTPLNLTGVNIKTASPAGTSQA